LCWSSNLGRLNLIENFDKKEFDFTNCFKTRTHSDYGLKYDIISVTNSETSLPSNSSIFNPQLATSSSVNMSAVPLALVLSTVKGVKSIIRSDFMSNLKLDEFKNADDDVSSNISYLWKWFECKYFCVLKIFVLNMILFYFKSFIAVNRFFETSIPLNPRTNQSEISQASSNSLIDLYPIRYCGLKSLLNGKLCEKKLIFLLFYFNLNFK